MATPYDGKVSLWHWKGQAVSEATIEALVSSLKRQVPTADAIFVKTSDGNEWQGNFDNKTSMRIAGPADIARWVSSLALPMPVEQPVISTALDFSIPISVSFLDG